MQLWLVVGCGRLWPEVSNIAEAEGEKLGSASLFVDEMREHGREG